MIRKILTQHDADKLLPGWTNVIHYFQDVHIIINIIIVYKILLMAYKVLRGQAPSYPEELLAP